MMTKQSFAFRLARRDLLWIFVFLFGVSLLSFSFYPGLENGDILVQLDQARKNVYLNWHPAMLAFVLRYLDKLIPGLGGIFLMHTILFWGGLCLLMRRITGRMGPFLALAVGFFPPLFMAYGNLVKDCDMIGANLLAFALFLEGSLKKSRILFFSALIISYYACGTRHNAIFALLPLFVWVGWEFGGLIFPSRIGRLVLGLGLAALIWGGVFFFERSIVLQPNNAYESQVILINDVAGISIQTGHLFLPSFYDRGKVPFTVEDLRSLYKPWGNSDLLWGDDIKVRRPGVVWDDKEYGLLLNSWMTAVRSEPVAYLKQRYSVFKALLGIGLSEYFYYWYPSDEKLASAPTFRGRIKRILVKEALGWRKSFLFKGWFYFLLLLLAFPFQREYRAILSVLFASGLLYELAYFFCSPGADFRFSWWCMVVALILWAVLIDRWVDSYLQSTRI